MKKLFTILSFILFPVITFAQFSGTYYIGTAGTKPGGGDPNYLSLKSACDALNAGSVTGNCTFYITSDLTEPENVALGVNTAGNTLTFKPYSGVSPTINFTQLADNAGPSGEWVIGSNATSSYSLVPTDNIVIDGSNVEGGTTRDLTITNVENTPAYAYGIRIVGSCNNVTIKNTKVIITETGGSSSYGILFSLRNQNSTDYIPTNGTVENCSITIPCKVGHGISIVNSGTMKSGSVATGMVFKNNTVNAGTRGIFVSYAKNTVIDNNTIVINQASSGYISHGIFILTSNGTTGTWTISNNKISLKTANTQAASGLLGINCETVGTYNISNNMIYNFSTPLASLGMAIGIRINSATINANIYHNSIYIPNTNMTASDPGLLSCIYFLSSYSGTSNITNNILACSETDATAYLINKAGATGTINSDGNNLSINGSTTKLGNWNTTVCNNLDEWKASTSQDAHSKSVAINFVSLTDLHLAGTSIGDVNLIGIAGTGITTDIDGETRSASYPYMGADEIPSSPLPVTLTSFNALVNGSNVELNWNTATELNSSKFEIERKNAQVENWTKIGEVAAHGNSNSPKQYSYIDHSPLAGKNVYRLKMIDNDGSFEYSSIAEVNFAVSQKPDLLQNYPNPFNPETVIRFSLPEASTVSLKIYNSIGEEVAELVNGHMDAGIHNVTFNASNLASGVYLYKLQTENFVKTMKMQLVK